MAEALGRIVDGQHVLTLRVYWEDTDAGGIVYYANYLRFTERARSDMLALAGIEQQRLLADDDVMFTVRECHVEYLRPARLDDDLEVATRLCAIGGASLAAEQIVRRPGGETLARTQVRVACVNVEGRPRRLPTAVRQALKGLPIHSGT